VGIFAECVVDLYRHIELAETRFIDIGLQMRSPVLGSSADAPLPLYPRPAPQSAEYMPEMVVAGASMKKLMEEVQRAGRMDAPALIQGESGVGKELVARALHRLGHHARGPFIPINCAALAPDLIASELFGHVRGAYTGAYTHQGGLFEAADGGTLFLDEIGEASPELQAALLRAIEEGQIRPVGSARSRKVNVRIVAATNSDLDASMAQGAFRRDLYYRLSGNVLDVPPLRRRRGDIPHLAYALAQWETRQKGDPCPGITRAAMSHLQAYNWPGNVRELLREIERAVTAADGQAIEPVHLSPPVVAKGATPRPAFAPSSDSEERQRIVAALDACAGNRSAAARQLNMHRATLYRRMRRLKID